MGLSITKVRVYAAVRVVLDVHNGDVLPDSGFPSVPVQPAQDSWVYDVDRGDNPQTVPHAAAFTGFEQLFVSVKGFTSESQATSSSTRLQINGIDYKEFSYEYISENRSYGKQTGWLDWSVQYRQGQFPLAQIKSIGVMIDSPENTSSLAAAIALEVYLLPKFLPSYFAIGTQGDKHMPLLFLRMFAGAARMQKISTDEQWVSLVTRICHGSAQPETGAKSNTENHWLKYDAWHGQTSFVRPNTAVSSYNNYGGDFLLSAWLWAYRIWKGKNVVTLVNCFDQAAIVEVALSLALDPVKVAWEHQAPYGFINEANNATLVGWGPCNDPFFNNEKKTGTKLVDPLSQQRSPFKNHSYLIWTPGENRPEFYEDGKVLPPVQQNSKAYAIDACAGPHLGDEVRGEWQQPWKISKSADNKTYSSMRDTFYSSSFDQAWWEKNYKDHHRCSRGIIGLAEDKAAADVYVPGQDPFRDTWEEYAPPRVSPYDSEVNEKVIAKVLSDFEDNFMQYTNESGGWIPVPIADVRVEQGALCREAKVYEPGPTRIRYYSVRMTTFKSYSSARSYVMACAAFGVVSSGFPGVPQQKPVKREIPWTIEEKTIMAYAIQVGPQYAFCYKNLTVEVNGLRNLDNIVSVAEKVARKTMEIDVSMERS